MKVVVDEDMDIEVADPGKGKWIVELDIACGAE